MAKVVTLHGARPGGWSKDRWRWLGAVRRDGDLSPMARLIACALGFGFANNDTGECRPGLATLAQDCATSPRTVDRCLGELQARGWIVRKGGNAPGIRAAIGFRFPGQHTPEMAREHTPEMATEHTPDLTGTHAISDAPPTPPYKEEPNLNQKPAPRAATRIIVPGGQRPTPLSQVVQKGTEAEADWNRWLSEKGFPELEQIGRVVVVGMLEGWDMPWRYPPPPRDERAERVAWAYANWLRIKA